MNISNEKLPGRGTRTVELRDALESAKLAASEAEQAFNTTSAVVKALTKLFPENQHIRDGCRVTLFSIPKEEVGGPAPESYKYKSITSSKLPEWSLRAIAELSEILGVEEGAFEYYFEADQSGNWSPQDKYHISINKDAIDLQ